MVKENSYDYCICFMELPNERALAERLLTEVSSYKLPKKVQISQNNLQYSRGYLLGILPGTQLSREQLDILNRSRWLMVVCTKQTKGDNTISQVINYFSYNRGKDYILPVLLDGEPLESFPPEFFSEREETVRFADGTIKLVKEIIEPLAIDVRGRDIKASLSLLRHVRIKIVAALINVSYDTLVQRHEKRAHRRLKILISAIVAVPLFLGAIFTYLWLNADYQINVAIKKTQVSKDLLSDMCQNYPVLFSDFPEAKPLVDSVLIESLEMLRVAESAYIPLLKIDNLLIPNEDDTLEMARNKAKLLRYIGKKDEAIDAYKMVAQIMVPHSEDYTMASRLFVEKADIITYPCGVWVKSIDHDVSEACNGLKSGDIIVTAGGFKFRSIIQFNILMESKAPDKYVELIVLRPKNGDFKVLSLDIKPEDLVFESEEM